MYISINMFMHYKILTLLKEKTRSLPDWNISASTKAAMWHNSVYVYDLLHINWSVGKKREYATEAVCMRIQPNWCQCIGLAAGVCGLSELDVVGH